MTEIDLLRARVKELEARFAKFTTVGCSCGDSDCDAGDCYGCRGHMIGILQEELDEERRSHAHSGDL